MATSMGRARSIAVNAADIAKLPADFDALSIMEALMFENMRRPTQKDTWQSIGSVARILAGKLVVARELEKVAAAPDLAGESSGQGAHGESPNNVGMSALPPGEMVGRASAIDREERRALIGGVNAQPELKSSIAGTPDRSARRRLQRPAQSLRAVSDHG